MLQYMLDTHICIYVIKNQPTELRQQFNRLAEQICISAITLAELYYGVEKSSRRIQNLQAVEQFVARLEALPFRSKRRRTMAKLEPNWSASVGLLARTTC